MEWRARLLLTFDRMDPSVAVGGASKEEGPSSSVNGEATAGLVVVGVDGVMAAEVTGLDPGDCGGKVGGSSLKPGLFGEVSMAGGERDRLACSFSIRAEFLLVLAGRGEVPPTGSWFSSWGLGSDKERGGRRLIGFSVFSVAGAESLNRPASSDTEHRGAASSSILLVVR